MTPSISLVSSIYLRSMKIPNREFFSSTIQGYQCGDESRTTRPLYLHLSFEHVWLRVHMPHDASQNKTKVGHDEQS